MWNCGKFITVIEKDETAWRVNIALFEDLFLTVITSFNEIRVADWYLTEKRRIYLVQCPRFEFVLKCPELLRKIMLCPGIHHCHRVNKNARHMKMKSDSVDIGPMVITWLRGRPGDLWRAIRITGRYKDRELPLSRYSSDELNDFFSSSFEKCDFQPSPKISAATFVLSPHEVEFHLKGMKRKGSGPDGIPFWIFRDFAYFLCDAVTSIFNRSISSGVVPLCFKRADISPIPKCAKPRDPSQFRPISLLPLLSKLLEKIVLRKMILPHINGSLDRSQFAYRPGPGGGVVPALTLLHHRILNFLDSKSGAVRLLTVDFAKAFDKITHTTIVSACWQFQLPASTVQWIEDFLSDRSQRVRCNGTTSRWAKMG